MLQLEKFSYYQHLSLTGGQERRISACRIFEIRGTRYHVLSQIQDAGLDFTGRTNFLAHHLVFTPEEIRQFASPPVIFAKWSGWLNSWNKAPENLENEDWGNLSGLSSVVSVPAQNWQILSGEAANGYGMLEIRSGSSFRVDNVSEEQILALFAESLELLELRDPRRDYRVSAWQYTFTTSMQEQDNPADFRWRCLHSDNPASSRFAGPDCRALTDVRLVRVTSEEKSFAQNSRQAPRIVVQPHDVRLKEGEATQLSVKAEGVPAPSYQWYSVDKSSAGQIIPNATGPELPLPNPPFGVSRYVVQVINSVGEVTSEVAKVECEKKLKLTPSSQAALTQQAGASSFDSDYEAKRDNQRRRLQQEEENRENKNRRIWNTFTMVFGMIVLGVLIAVVVVVMGKGTSNGGNNLSGSKTNSPLPTASVVQNSANTTTATNNPDQSVAKIMAQPKDLAKSANSKIILTAGDDALTGDWAEQLIGNPKYHRDQLKDTNRFLIKCYVGDFSDKQDNVFYVYKNTRCNEFTAKVSMESTAGVSGVMIRDSLEKNAKFLFVGVAPQKIYIYRRDASGVSSNILEIAKINNAVNIELGASFDLKDKQWVPNYSVGAGNSVSLTQYNLSMSSNAFVGFTQVRGTQDAPAAARFIYRTTAPK